MTVEHPLLHRAGHVTNQNLLTVAGLVPHHPAITAILTKEVEIGTETRIPLVEGLHPIGMQTEMVGIDLTIGANVFGTSRRHVDLLLPSRILLARAMPVDICLDLHLLQGLDHRTRAGTSVGPGHHHRIRVLAGMAMGRARILVIVVEIDMVGTEMEGCPENEIGTGTKDTEGEGDKSTLSFARHLKFSPL
jgi:hypothetical protein